MPLRFPDVCLIRKVPFPESVEAYDAERVRPATRRETELEVSAFYQSETLESRDQFDRFIPGDGEGTRKAFQRRGHFPVLVIIQVLERVLDEDARRSLGGTSPAGNESLARPRKNR